MNHKEINEIVPMKTISLMEKVHHRLFGHTPSVVRNDPIFGLSMQHSVCKVCGEKISNWNDGDGWM